MSVNPVLCIRQHSGIDLTCLKPDVTLNLKENYLAHLLNIKLCFILHAESLTCKTGIVFWIIFDSTIPPYSVHYLIHHSAFWVSLTQRLKCLCFIFSDLICSGEGNTLVKKAWINTSVQTAIYPIKVIFILVGHLGIKQSHHARYAAHQTCINISFEREDRGHDTWIHRISCFRASAVPSSSFTRHFRVKYLFLEHSDLTGARNFWYLII